LKLYWHPFSIFPRRVRIALREKDIAHEEVVVDLPAGAQHAPEFRRLNPFGQMPVLEDGDVVVSESIAILEYIEERYPTPPLLSPYMGIRARTRELMLWSGDYLAPAWKAWMAPRFSPDAKPTVASVVRGRDDIAAHLDVLEARLGAKGEYLAGDYSLADVCYAPFVTTFAVTDLDDLLETRPAVRAWVERLAARPAVRDTAPV